MADIRIKDLAVTASSSASDDYLAVDGSTNGTRKLSAYSPTFGGNLTVSGTGTSSVAGNLTVKSATAYTNFTVGESSNTYSVFFYGANQSNGIAFGTNGSNVPLINGFNNTFTAAQTLALQANGGNLLIGTTTDGGQKLQVSGTAYVSGDATFAGSVRPEATPSSKWGIDFAASGASGALVTIANDGTYDLAVGSGMVFLWDDGGNGVSQIATYYGITAIVWQSGANLYSTTVDTANKVNVYYNAGTNKYRIQNKFGSTVSIYVSTLKLRGGS